MAKPFFNIGDSELLSLAKHTAEVIGGDPTAYGASPADVAALSAFIDTFKTDLEGQKAARSAARAATAKKNKSRAPLMAALRDRRNVAKAMKVAPKDFKMLGIPTSTVDRAPAATFPFGSVDTSERMRHTIHWTDAGALGNKRKPRGVMGCEVWVKVGGDEPGDKKDCVFLTVNASTPFVAEYGPDNVGKMCHYMLRWRMRDGSVSAWSETVSATITG